ncbi:hypothetical protein SAMN05444164_5006 [Bradyrhizobium erythrophlei]|uniref:Uncharacterized protein n=1 Tax=Bradyrhizobium erythrophlei TaxID=1437360 RepID=A0A1H5BDM6_9BRAD|nr:hypothetical protein SAMN05444164_5006 [Bradyrhizobium erythrophlei]
MPATAASVIIPNISIANRDVRMIPPVPVLKSRSQSSAA